ncbi:G protein-activated inward rectifier potassium channel 3-like [Tetranychus urticae]|uniref:Inward rectifier potassium channel C-terminal domain-containing protein n=1 Tax=Tetranychus urticae TaxID=32264 RepID=T1KWD7_TETUR|nr:G protein-activated inward rectifier potassium channel 3-like [Tetranychus urticae]
MMETDKDWKDNNNAENRLLSSTIIDIKNATDCDLTATPQSTVTTEYGKQLTYRFKSTNAFGNAEYTNTFTNSSTINNNNNHVSTKGKSKIFPGRIRKRVVLKNGSVNLSKERVEKRSQRYLQDTFTTMVDIQWRWNLLVFSMGFLLSWLGFAVVWYLIAYAHGDIDGSPSSSSSSPSSTDKPKCVNGVDSFSTAFLFSIETQHTIGYGSRYTNEECPEAIFVMCVQSITGVMIQCFVVGFVFAKLSRPKKRSQTLMFSRNACICLRDGKLCLMFRVGDVRNRSHIIGASISALVIDRKITSEGEVIPYYHNRVDVKFDNSDSNVFLVWPATIVHEVDSSSPFYSMSADAMIRERFEIVVILEGTIESTGQSIQARTSYLPCEILWGHRFEQMIGYRKDTGQYRVDYSKFNNTYEIDTPTSSAKDYYEYQKFVNSTYSRGLLPVEMLTDTKTKDEDVNTYSPDSGLSNNSYDLLAYPFPTRSE